MSKSAVVATAAGLSVAVVVGGAFAAANFLGGGGAQPEDVLPGNTLAFVKVDMDPGAGQKVNVYKLAKKFESVDAKSADDLKDALLTPVFADVEGIDYAKDIKPWLGDRAAMAAVPHTEDGAAPLVVIEFTDEQKMEAGLAKVEKAAAAEASYDYETLPPMGEDLAEAPEPAEPADEFAWAVKDNFVLISTDQATADAAAKSDDVLADDADYTADIAALDGDQIVTAWVDLEATYAAIPEDAPSAGDLLGTGPTLPSEDPANPEVTETPEVSATGSVVVGVSAQPDHVEMVAKSIDVEVQGVPVTPAVPGTGMVADFPADTVAALSVSGLGATMTTLYDSLGATVTDLGAPEMAAQYGMVLPDDLETIFGTDLAAGLRLGSVEDFDVFAKVRTADPDRATSLIDALTADISYDTDYVFTEPRGDHYVAGSSPEALALPDAGGLGADPAFKKVVADAEDANAVGFVDIAALVDLLVTPEEPEYGDVKPLDAFGFSVTGDESNSTVTARLSVR